MMSVAKGRRISSARSQQRERTASIAAPTPPAPPRWLLALALLAMPLVAYIPALSGEFIWDDFEYILKNPVLRDASGWWRLWIPGETPQFYPLVFSGFWLEFRLWSSTTGYHVVNVILHGAGALLAWRVAERLKIPGAWMIAAVFALHPVHVESVAYISERKNVLSGLFYFMSMLAYLRFDVAGEGEHLATNEVGGASGRRQAWGWYALSLVCFLLALLSKTVTCSLPVALMLAALWQRRSLTRSRLLLLLPYFALGLVLAMQTARVERATVGAVGPHFDFSFPHRLLIASRALLFYPYELLWPANLTLMYERWEIDPSRVLDWWPLAVVVGIGAILAAAFRRGMRGPGLALAFYAVTIFPALGFIDFYPMMFSFVADHFQYLASLGVIALLVGGVARALTARRWAPVLSVAILLLLGGLTFIQAGTYASSLAIWSHAVSVNPRAWAAQHNLAVVLQAEGHLDLAEERYRLAVSLNSDYHDGHRALGDFLQSAGRLQEALAEYRLALECVRAIEPDLVRHVPAMRENPPSAQYHLRIAQVLDSLGRHDEADRTFRDAIAIAPLRVEMHFGLAMHLSSRGRHEEAATELLQAIHCKSLGSDARLVSIAPTLSPSTSFLHARLADEYRSLQRWEDALKGKQAATDKAVGEQERLTAQRELADFLATCSDDRVRNGEEATALAEQIVRRTERRDPSALMTLAAAYAEVGRFDEAITASNEALRLAAGMDVADVRAQVESRLARYRLRQPARE